MTYHDLVGTAIMIRLDAGDDERNTSSIRVWECRIESGEGEVARQGCYTVALGLGLRRGGQDSIRAEREDDSKDAKCTSDDMDHDEKDEV
jgi:hypothetical protein